MFTLHENEREYRFGDSGPKYLMKGPRSNFAIVRFNPGEDLLRIITRLWKKIST